MSNDRPKRDTMSIEEATVSNMWEMAAARGQMSAAFNRTGSFSPEDADKIRKRSLC